MIPRSLLTIYFSNHFSANYIQLEPDEIMGTSHYSERNMPSCVRLGDLGYLLQYDIFKPLINARALMSNYQVQPWQQNPCTQLSKGIWRSPYVRVSSKIMHGSNLSNVTTQALLFQKLKTGFVTHGMSSLEEEYRMTSTTSSRNI